jgi:hypothetical protein
VYFYVCDVFLDPFTPSGNYKSQVSALYLCILNGFLCNQVKLIVLFEVRNEFLNII